MTATSFEELTTNEDGLVPCIVQDARTGTVLMLGYQDAKAWSKMLETGLVHFHSRSRDELWMKGESSGNLLGVTATLYDCDRDTILVLVTPEGPTCHTGALSCFGDTTTRTLGGVLDMLGLTIQQRRHADPSESYTASLIADGDLAARKVLEEAGELAFAAKDTAGGTTDQRVVEEAADLLYHTLALMAEQSIDPARVAAELVGRTG